VAKKKHQLLLLKLLLLHQLMLLHLLIPLLLLLPLPPHLLKRRSNFFCFRKNATLGWLFFACVRCESASGSADGQ
jgi:hypothetical protein